MDQSSFLGQPLATTLPVREMEADELSEGTRECHESRVASAGLTLDTEIPPGFRVRVGTAAAEPISFMLIHNTARASS